MERIGCEIVLQELDSYQGHLTPRAEPSPGFHLLHRKAKIFDRLVGTEGPASFLLLWGSRPPILGPKNAFLVDARSAQFKHFTNHQGQLQRYQ